MATRAGFTYREAEELRLAVGEAAALLAPDPDGDGILVIAYDVEDETLSVDLRLTEQGGATVDVPDVAAAVLDASVDTWRLDAGGDAWFSTSTAIPTPTTTEVRAQWAALRTHRRRASRRPRPSACSAPLARAQRPV